MLCSEFVLTMSNYDFTITHYEVSCRACNERFVVNVYGCELALRYFKRSSEKGHMIRAHI